MRLFLLKMYINIRWAYFHVSPNYVKFYMTKGEAHFQHMKTGQLFCNYTIINTGKDTND